jgi:flagellar motor switch protein FliM
VTLVSARTRRDRGEAVPFDFRRPSKFSRDHVRAFQIVHETFARQFSTVLATTLRAVANVTFGSVDQLTYDEYVRSLPNPTYLGVLSLSPLPGPAVFQLPLSIVFASVDRLLGGTGESPAPERPLTEIEASLMKGVVRRTLKELEYAYESLVAVEADIVQQESNPQFLQIAAPSDMVLAVSFEVRIGDQHGTASLCIPYGTMQPVLERLASENLFEDRSGRDPVAFARALESAVAEVPVEISVRFAEVALPSREIVQLRVGDVVPLCHPVDEPLTVSVDGVPCYEAVTGRKGKHLACLVVGDLHTPGEQHP